MDDRRRVVLGVLPGACRVSKDGGTQDVFRQVVGAPYALVDHVVEAQGGAIPAHVHADLDENGDDAGVLADRTMPRGAHARVDQDLRHRVAGSRRLFAQVRLVHGLDEVDGVVIGNELQSVGNALYQVVLLDQGHGARSSMNVGNIIVAPACMLARGCGAKGAAVYRARPGVDSHRHPLAIIGIARQGSGCRVHWRPIASMGWSP